MRYELFIAWRYLRSQRARSFVSVITGIAILAITVGVASLVFALALMRGFRTEIQSKLLQGTAHLNLLKTDGSEIENYQEIAQHLSKVPGVVAVSATTYTPCILGIGERSEQAILKGVDMSAPPAANEIFTTIIQGNAQLLGQSISNDDSNLKGIVIGQELARTLSLKMGDTVTANVLGTRLTPLGLQSRARTANFQVIGFFSSGLYEYDAKWAYLSLSDLQSLTGSNQTAGTIQMKVKDIYDVETTATNVLQHLKTLSQEQFSTHSWQELNRPLFSALQLQQRVVLTFLSILIGMAALNIISSLTMLVLEKRQDISILRAQGATPQAVAKIFRLQGLAIGLVSCLTGIPLGLLAIKIANHWQLISLPSEIYSIRHIQLAPNAFDSLGITILILCLSFLATLYPVYIATRTTPLSTFRRS